MDALDHLNELCKDLELNPLLQKTEKGRSILPLADDLQIEVQALTPMGVFFYCPICPCPQLKKEELFIYLMKANLFGQGTFGATIGMDKNELLLTLSHALPIDMKYSAFKSAFEDFANMVDYWREEIDRHNQEAQNSPL